MKRAESKEHPGTKSSVLFQTVRIHYTAIRSEKQNERALLIAFPVFCNPSEMKNGEVDQNLTIFLCKKNVTSGSDGRRLLSGNFFFVILLIPATRSDDNAATTIPS
jgi:hypothetical protein